MSWLDNGYHFDLAVLAILTIVVVVFVVWQRRAELAERQRRRLMKVEARRKVDRQAERAYRLMIRDAPRITLAKDIRFEGERRG